MRPLLASVLVVAFAAAPSAQRARSGVATLPPTRSVVVTAERIDRFAQWIKAVHDHEPGERDDALDRVVSWSGDQLRAVWADAQFLTALMRNLNLSQFAIPEPREKVALVYNAVSLQRMRAMACAAAGRLASAECRIIRAVDSLDADLKEFAADALADRERSEEDNYLLRRAALLHADIEILVNPVLDVEPSSSSPPLPGPRRMRADTSDGVAVNVHETGVHWEIARTMLSLVVPAHLDRPAPAKDAMVRDWYHATTVWMQHVESHDRNHVDRARELFPNDPDILFLAGTLHENYASSEIQAAAHSVAMPTGFDLNIGSARSELRQAEAFFRRAVAQAPGMAEAHLRLGRVLGVQGHHAEALRALEQAIAQLDDDELAYDARLFIGCEYEALGRYDEARAAYEAAAALYPGAQSPLIALSQLARRRGDRPAALAAIARMFALPPPGDGDRTDPWWTYKTAQARNAGELLETLRAPFRRSAQ